MATSLPGIIIKIGADTNDAVQGINKVNNALGRSMSPGQKFDSVLGKLGPALAAAGAAAAYFGVQFATASIDAASNLQEMQTKVDQVFGAGGSATLKSWAATAAESMGLSQRAALDAASQFGIFGQAAGLTGTDVITFSEKLTGLAGDLASFNNTSVDDALLALQAGLRGESEPLRRYGILLDDATLKTAAFELGIYSGTGVLTQQQRVLAANKVIFEQSTKAQGDFARTSDGLANTQRSLQAGFENMQAAIGKGLLDAINQITKSLGGGEGLIGTMESLAKPIVTTAQEIGVLGAALGSLVNFVNDKIPGADTTLTDFLTGPTDGIKQATFVVDLFSAGLAKVTGNEIAFDEANRRLNDQAVLTYGTLRDSYAAIAAYDTGLTEAEVKQQAAADAAKQLEDQLKGVNQQFKDTNARLDFLDYLDEVKTKFDKNSKSISDYTAAGRDNQRVLQEGYSLAIENVQGWQQQTNASQEQVKTKTAATVAQLRRTWIASGLSATDVDRWLAVNTGWVPAWNRLAAKAAEAGGAIGRGLGDGILKGMSSRERAIAAEGARLTAMAEAGARNQSKTRSPSLVWYGIGQDLGEGLVRGIKSKQGPVEQAAKIVAGLAATAAAGVLKFNALKDELLGHIDDLNTATSAVKELRDQMNQYAGSVAKALTGSISLRDALATQTDTQESANPVTWLDAFTAQITDTVSFSNNLANLAGKIGTSAGARELIDQIAGLGPDAGNALLGELTAETANNLARRLDGALKAADAAGIGIAAPFYRQGINAAISTMQGLMAEITADEKELRKIGQQFGIPIGEEIKRAIIDAFNAAQAQISGGGGGGSNADYSAGNGAGTYKPVFDKGTTVTNNITVQTGVGDPAAIAKSVAAAVTVAARRVGASR